MLILTHDDMHSKVEDDRDPGGTGLSIELDVAKSSGGAVVEDVKESYVTRMKDERVYYQVERQGRTKGLFLEGKENGVNELDVFEGVVDHVVEFKSL